MSSTVADSWSVSSVRHWPGMRSEYSRLPPHDYLTVTKPGQIGVSFTNHSNVVQERDGRAAVLDVAAGMVFATGAQPVTWAQVHDPTEVVEIYPDQELLQAAAASSQAGRVEIEPVSGVRDATVLGIAAVLKRAHVHGIDLGDVYASTLAHRLAEHVLTTYCGLGEVRRQPAGRLDRVLLERVTALIDARLGETLTLGDLAGAAGLSPFHFARVFRATTGMAPHQFVTMRRMERAKTLLLATALSVEQIAFGLGFSNLSHFRRTFRRYTGFAPSDLRAR
jgi:AraC family transcriptional regulator